MSASDSTALLASIRRRAFAPTATSTGTLDADLLALADDEILYTLLPEILAVREEFYDFVVDVPIVGGQSSYDIPYRAIGPKLREVSKVDSAGNVVDLDLIRIEDLARYGPQPGQPSAFYLMGDSVVLFPVPAPNVAGQSLRLHYHLRPNRLIPPASAGVILTVNPTSIVLTDTPPAGFISGALFDFIKVKPNFKTFDFDKACTGVSVNTLSFAAGAIPTGVAAGDYLCLAEQTPVPQVPREFHPVLAQLAANTVMRNLGNPRYAAGRDLALELIEKCKVLLTQRVEGEVEVLINDAFYPASFMPW